MLLGMKRPLVACRCLPRKEMFQISSLLWVVLYFYHLLKLFVEGLLAFSNNCYMKWHLSLPLCRYVMSWPYLPFVLQKTTFCYSESYKTDLMYCRHLNFPVIFHRFVFHLLAGSTRYWQDDKHLVFVTSPPWAVIQRCSLGTQCFQWQVLFTWKLFYCSHNIETL